jgi:hypothetical protein
MSKTNKILLDAIREIKQHPEEYKLTRKWLKKYLTKDAWLARLGTAINEHKKRYREFNTKLMRELKEAKFSRAKALEDAMVYHIALHGPDPIGFVTQDRRQIILIAAELTKQRIPTSLSFKYRTRWNCLVEKALKDIEFYRRLDAGTYPKHEPRKLREAGPPKQIPKEGKWKRVLFYKKNEREPYFQVLRPHVQNETNEYIDLKLEKVSQWTLGELGCQDTSQLQIPAEIKFLTWDEIEAKRQSLT